MQPISQTYFELAKTGYKSFRASFTFIAPFAKRVTVLRRKRYSAAFDPEGFDRLAGKCKQHSGGVLFERGKRAEFMDKVLPLQEGMVFGAVYSLTGQQDIVVLLGCGI